MPVSRHCSHATGRGAARSSRPRRPDHAAAASPRLHGVPDELAGLLSGVGLVAAGRCGSLGIAGLLSLLASCQPGQIIQGVAVNVVGGCQQDVFHQQRGSALLGERADAAIARLLQRHADAFMRQPHQERHALFLALAQHPLVVVQVRAFMRLTRRPVCWLIG